MLKPEKEKEPKRGVPGCVAGACVVVCAAGAAVVVPNPRAPKLKPPVPVPVDPNGFVVGGAGGLEILADPKPPNDVELAVVAAGLGGGCDCGWLEDDAPVVAFAGKEPAPPTAVEEAFVPRVLPLVLITGACAGVDGLAPKENPLDDGAADPNAPPNVPTPAVNPPNTVALVVDVCGWVATPLFTPTAWPRFD